MYSLDGPTSQNGAGRSHATESCKGPILWPRREPFDVTVCALRNDQLWLLVININVIIIVTATGDWWQFNNFSPQASSASYSRSSVNCNHDLNSPVCVVLLDFRLSCIHRCTVGFEAALVVRLVLLVWVPLWLKRNSYHIKHTIFTAFRTQLQNFAITQEANANLSGSCI